MVTWGDRLVKNLCFIEDNVKTNSRDTLQSLLCVVENGSVDCKEIVPDQPLLGHGVGL